jgi:hypothetical protein
MPPRKRKLRPDYAVGLYEKEPCRSCGTSRYIRTNGPWQNCTGAGPSQSFTCGYCGSAGTRWRPCSHQPGTPMCDYKGPPLPG